MARYYRLLLDDYSSASFTSFSKEYFGTLDQLKGLFDDTRSDEDIAKDIRTFSQPLINFSPEKRILLTMLPIEKCHSLFMQRYWEWKLLCLRITNGSISTLGGGLTL